MPGKQLMCVWDVVAILDINKKIPSCAPKETTKKITSMFNSLQSVNYSEHVFDETFPGDFIKFEEYLDYLQKSLREKGVSLGIFRESLEQVCWDMVKGSYKYSIPQNDVEKLWKICNRLMKDNTYPPVMCREEVCWLTDRILSNIGNIIKSTDEMFKVASYDFKSLMKILEDLLMKETTKEKTKKCIDDLYSWLVLEISKKSRVFIRCKKRSNWSTWAKRCCILTPKSVCVYSGRLDKLDTSTKKIELVLTRNSKAESLTMYNGMIHHLKGRFSVANQPVMELEIAVNDDAEKRSWLTSLEDIISCIRENTTPLQKLLRERYAKRMENAESVKKSSSMEKLESALDEAHKRTSKAITFFDHNIDVDGDSMAANLKSQIVLSSELVLKTKPLPVKQTKVQTPQKTNHRLNNDNSIIDINREKLKTVFMKIDLNGNGLLDRNEFSKFMTVLGLRMDEKEINLVFKTVDSGNKGEITFEQFEVYFSKHVLDETSTAECVNALRKAFLEADRDGSGSLNFREFTEYIWEKKRSIRMSKLLRSFATCDNEEMTFTDFQHLVQGGESDVLNTIIEEDLANENMQGSNVGQFQSQLKQLYDETDTEELASYIRDRWKNFATFRRPGHTGTIVMKGGHGMVADYVPGEYSLIDLACFSDLPPLVPKHTVVKGVTWTISNIPGKSGKLIFPADYDGEVVTELATTELLRYYGCSFADKQQEKVSLLYRHGIQDFTYENGYLEKYVAESNGGSGLERHEFSHLDCSLNEQSGTFVLAKFNDDGDFHITGFKIPLRHTLYIPGGCIHSNDYLRGTWRTMLSDETDIDHVHLTRMNNMHGDEIYDNAETKFQFTFT